MLAAEVAPPLLVVASTHTWNERSLVEISCLWLPSSPMSVANASKSVREVFPTRYSFQNPNDYRQTDNRKPVHYVQVRRPLG